MSSFDIGKFTNDTAKWVVSSPATVTFTSNAIYMALILTIFALFIISYISESKNRYVKTGIYLLIANSIIIFIHHYALSARLTEQYKPQPVPAGDIPDEYKLTPTIGRGEFRDRAPLPIEPESPPQISPPVAPVEPVTKQILDKNNTLDVFNL